MQRLLRFDANYFTMPNSLKILWLPRPDYRTSRPGVHQTRQIVASFSLTPITTDGPHAPSRVFWIQPIPL